MIDLYTVPLGATARDFFSAEAENKYSYDEALLVLPSRLLVNCLLYTSPSPRDCS